MKYYFILFCDCCSVISRESVGVWGSLKQVACDKGLKDKYSLPDFFCVSAPSYIYCSDKIISQLLHWRLRKASNPTFFWVEIFELICIWHQIQQLWDYFVQEWTSILKSLLMLYSTDWHGTTVGVKLQYCWYLSISLLSDGANVFSNISHRFPNGMSR